MDVKININDVYKYIKYIYSIKYVLHIFMYKNYI